jgi:phytoene dehydrogenase-like protein
MEDDMKPVVIVGAGMSGLACAVTLQEAGIPLLVVEASDQVGGRVRTDQKSGFLLDRGFQVYLDAYPESGKLLDLEALDLRAFEPGALVFNGRKLHQVMDVFRKPKSVLRSLLSPVGTIVDKLRVAVLRQRLLDLTLDEIASRPDRTTESQLREFGFSKRMIDGFFRSFYGGIFLERDLRTSSRLFEFTFRMFSEGHATVPAKGMGEIPKQLASRLPEDALRLLARVKSVSPSGVILEDGEVIEGSRVIVATEAPVAAQLVAPFAKEAPEWRAVTNLYFNAKVPPIDEAIIALNGTSKGLVNNVAVMSKISPDYAPQGRSLVSVSVLGENNNDDLPATVQKELQNWFGTKVESWEHLRTDVIRYALPKKEKTGPVAVREIDGVLICGDHTVSASIEGAVVSGKAAAGLILEQQAEAV